MARILRKHLVKGMTLDAQTVGFIDATVSVDRAADLAALLSDSGNDAAEPLLDLIFYPDCSLQEKIEDVLGTAVFTPSDVDGVVGRLMDPPVDVPLIFSDLRGSHCFKPDRETISRMVDRLRLNRAIPGPVLKACQSLPPATALKVRVRIRNTSIAWSNETAEFLAGFLTGADPNTGDFQGALQTALAFMGILSPSEGIFAGLSRRRRELVDALSRTERMAMETSGKNMETLMLQGIRLPYLDSAAARQTIRHIDLICRTVFGRIDLAGPGPRAEDLGTVSAPDDLQGILRRLS